MLNQINQFRAEKKLPPLELCKELKMSAEKFARDMAFRNFFSHTGQDGTQPGDRIEKAGYLWTKANAGSSVAENIAAGQKSVKEVMAGWRKSPSHYKNIMNPRFRHAGFGKSSNPQSEFGTYWVQNFGYGATCSA